MIIFTQQRLMQRNAQQWLTRHLSHQSRKTIVPSVPHNMKFFSQQQQPSFEQQQQQVGRTYVPSTSDSSDASSTQQSSFTSDLEKERIMAQRIRSTSSHGGKSGEIPKFRQQGGRSKLSTILMRLVISGGLGVACMVVAYGYYVTNKDKLSFTKNLEEEKKKKSSVDGDGAISANTVQKGFFSVGRTKTLRYQYIVTRSRIYELEVCRGELFNEKTDAIIVATTENLQPHDSALTDKSGREQTMKQLQEALVKNGGPFKPGQVVVTEVKSDDDQLNCKYLIHAVTPMYEGGQKLEVFQLSQAIYNALLEADKLSLESVSIPAIGTGNARFPREKCANVLFDSVFTYFNDRDSTVAAARQNKMSLHNVRFTNSDEQSIEAFVKEYDHKKRMGKILV